MVTTAVLSRPLSSPFLLRAAARARPGQGQARQEARQASKFVLLNEKDSSFSVVPFSTCRIFFLSLFQSLRISLFSFLPFPPLSSLPCTKPPSHAPPHGTRSRRIFFFLFLLYFNPPPSVSGLAPYIHTPTSTSYSINHHLLCILLHQTQIHGPFLTYLGIHPFLLLHKIDCTSTSPVRLQYHTRPDQTSPPPPSASASAFIHLHALPRLKQTHARRLLHHPQEVRQCDSATVQKYPVRP